ncbi:MAG: DUF2290 domain-containing protein [Pirellulaceae bacterium]|nr:DUF2290 domain-containing protein [Pirellulaceae bacterium]
MLTPQAVCQQIKTMVGYLVEVGLSSDQNVAFVRTHSRNMTEVTFPGAENVSVALKDRNYAEIYAQLESTRAYIAKLPDGALILMRYSYRDDELLQHSLGFYPSPSLEEFQNNPEIYLEEAVFADVVARNIVPFPIRFDFDCRPDVVKPVTHPKSHLTLGQYENCRIPVTCPLTPASFITFILRHFYNTAFVEFCERVPRFVECYDDSIHAEERCMIHVAVPRST